MAAALAWGWAERGSPALDPHAWPGYLFGLIGSLMMVMLLGFSWRKRVVSARLSVRWWYVAHVLLGCFGPVLVLIHARFAWGSINSSFALGATGLVVLSGLIGRYRFGPDGWQHAVAAGWHYAHVPLYGVMVIAVIVHVYMAHAY